jgi:hypothetical protein
MGDEEIMTYGDTVKEMAVVNLISEWGAIGGEHHKQWLLDQILRNILSQTLYEQWVREWEDGEEGPDTYTWDEGIAP